LGADEVQTMMYVGLAILLLIAFFWLRGGC